MAKMAEFENMVMKKLLSIIGLLGLSATSLSAASEERQTVDLDAVEIIGITPLEAGGIAIDKIPASVQTVSFEQLGASQSISLADYINRYLGSVHIN